MAVGVTYPSGFRAAGATAGIKASGRPDVALVTSDTPAVAAGVFTKSITAGAPVHYCRGVLARSQPTVRAVLVASGNANTATGRQGVRDTAAMAALTARHLGADTGEVLVCCTGVIGVALPMRAVNAGITTAVSTLSRDGGASAADAILTTDAAAKVTQHDADGTRIGGIAKGAGMIRPDLGTMIAILTTDAVIGADELQPLLHAAAAETFNRISVDGCTSTSDSVILLANGTSGRTPDPDTFRQALTSACLELALMIVRDGEGATRIARYAVTGARSDQDAERAARAVAEAQLVRCALHGADPNWGRMIAALGVCGADLDPGRVAITIGDVPVVRDGVGVDADTAAARAATRADVVSVRIDLGVNGLGTSHVFASDLSPGYVAANSLYTT
jgi:glutamate N-acetyltransferase / amino-acid N-acetyltransferase